MSEKWYKLDNAAKIFPALSADDGSNYFRLCAVLKEEVKPEILKEALSTALTRFPMFSVKLKQGIFWYYFEQNDKQPLIRKETSLMFDSVNTDEHHKFMFCLEYNGKRISLEMYHALTDGTGGMEFFKTILYYYLLLNHQEIENDGSIITKEYEKLTDEGQDSFVYNYDKLKKNIKKEPLAYKIKGTPYMGNWVGITHAYMNVDEVKTLAHTKGATITEYLGSVLLYIIYERYQDHKKRPITLFTPVNARKYFDSSSLRNFMLYIRTQLPMDNNQTYTFDDIINIVKTNFSSSLTKEHLTARLVSNVKIEKNIFIRILPLFIKKIALKLSYKAYGSDLSTFSFSNLGVIKVPKDIYNFVDNMYFMLGTNTSGPINLAASTFNNTLTLTFSSRIIERQIQKEFIRFLSNQGLSITIQTNDLEVEA